MATLKEKHTKTIKEMKTLLKSINDATADSLGDKSREKFLYNNFAAKWRKSGRTKELKSLMKSLGFKSSISGALFRDPKKLYLELNTKRNQLEQAMGAQKASDLVKMKNKFGLGDRGIFEGIKLPSTLSIAFNDTNPFYDREWDPQVPKLNQKIAERTRADYLRSTDQNAPGFDPDGWRLELPEGHPDRTFRAYDDVGAKNVTITGTQFPETGTIRESLKVNKAANNNQSSLGITDSMKRRTGMSDSELRQRELRINRMFPSNYVAKNKEKLLLGPTQWWDLE